VEDVNDVKSSLIKVRRIVFTPSVELKDELKNTPVIITCYDRNGDVVKRVTSTDDAVIDDGTGDSSSDSGNGNTGGDDNTGDQLP